jgi:outer membrane biosynthesis protein TonB
MQLSFLVSLLLHIIILLSMFFGLDVSYKKPIIDENTLVVDFAQLGPKTAAPVKLDIPEKEQKQKKTPQQEIKEPVEQKEKTDTLPEERDAKKTAEKVEQSKKTEKLDEKKESVNVKKITKEKKPEKNRKQRKKTIHLNNGHK